jgi:hypothetical protein
LHFDGDPSFAESSEGNVPATEGQGRINLQYNFHRINMSRPIFTNNALSKMAEWELVEW